MRRTKGLRDEVSRRKKQNEYYREEAGGLDTRTPESVRPIAAGLQRQPQGAPLVEGYRGRHGKVGGGGETEMEKSTRQVLQGEEATRQENPAAADRRRQPGGEARPGAVQPTGLAQRLRQAQSGDGHGGSRRGTSATCFIRHALILNGFTDVYIKKILMFTEQSPF